MLLACTFIVVGCPEIAVTCWSPVVGGATGVGRAVAVIVKVTLELMYEELAVIVLVPGVEPSVKDVVEVVTIGVPGLVAMVDVGLVEKLSLGALLVQLTGPQGPVPPTRGKKPHSMLTTKLIGSLLLIGADWPSPEAIVIPMADTGV